MLPLVLVVTVVLGAVIAAIATYTTTTLRYGQVVEGGAKRLGAAQAGMDFALGRLDRVSTLCSTDAGSDGTGAAIEFDSDVNGIRPEIRCSVLASGATSSQTFALVITGERPNPALSIDLGGNNQNAVKKIDGPVFIGADFTANPGLVDMNALLDHGGGDLTYRSSSCSPDDTVTGATPGARWRLVGGSLSRCTTKTWQQLFTTDRPVEPTAAALSALPMRSATTPPAGPGTCRVWEPGRYDSRPVLGTHNYFKSGEYLFNFPAAQGTWSIGSWVLFGSPAVGDPVLATTNHPCRDAWGQDTANGAGAAIYLGGHSRIAVSSSSGSSLELSARLIGSTYLSVLALESGPFESQVSSTNPILASLTGTNSQLAVRGLVWAPYHTISFENTTNGAVGQLSGGAVVAGATLGAPGTSPPSLVVAVPTIDAAATLQITSRAEDGGVSAVQAIVEYRATDGAVGVRSRRVLGLTPGDPIPVWLP